MQVTTKKGITRIEISDEELMRDASAAIKSEVVKHGFLGNIFIVYCPEAHCTFFMGPAKYEQLRDWICEYLIEAGAIPDLIRIYDPLIGAMFPYGTICDQRTLLSHDELVEVVVVE